MFASSIRRSLGGLIPPKIATPSAVVRVKFHPIYSNWKDLFAQLHPLAIALEDQAIISWKDIVLII
jgi:hypothetical protein